MPNLKFALLAPVIAITGCAGPLATQDYDPSTFQSVYETALANSTPDKPAFTSLPQWARNVVLSSEKKADALCTAVRGEQLSVDEFAQQLLTPGFYIDIPGSVRTAGYQVPLTQCLTYANKGRFVEALIDAGANVNVRGKNTLPALELAVFMGRADIVEQLIEAGANITPTQEQDPNLLLYLTSETFRGNRSQDARIVSAFARAGLDLDQPIDGMTPVTRALVKDRAEVAQALLDAGATKSRHTSEGTRLHIAAAAGSPETVTQLLAEGASPDQKLSDGTTDLRIALRNHQQGNTASRKTALLLTEVTRDLDALDSDGWSALMLAVAKNSAPVVKALLERGAKPDLRHWPEGLTPLHYAASNDTYPLITLLTAFGADIDAVDARGATALARAVKRSGRDAGGLKAIDALLAAGADPMIGLESQDYTGYSATFLAAIRQNPLAFRKLVAAGGQPGGLYNGVPYLVIAANEKNIIAMELLLQAGADPNAKARALAGETPLLRALRVGKGQTVEQSLEAVRVLLEAGADPNVPAPQYTYPSALVAALSTQNDAAFDLLMSAGANPNLRLAGDGATALSYFIEADDRMGFDERLRATRRLLNSGAKISNLNRNGQEILLLDLAITFGELPLVKLLVDAGANPQGMEAGGSMTLRQYAAKKGKQDIADYLANQGG